MRTTSRRHLPLVLLVAAACGGGSSGSERAPGDESFVARAPPGGSVAAGLPLGAGSSGSPATDAAATRTVEEADLYALAADGTTLFVLNGFRGLTAVDLADLDHPALLARVPLTGQPVDLYLRGGIAYVTVRDSVTWAWAGGESAVRAGGGSWLLAVDVAVPSRPVVLSRLALQGSVEESRIVGDVLYAVSRRWGWWEAVSGPGGAPDDSIYLASFDLSDPRAPRQVDRLDFQASGWSSHANVTASTVTLAQSGWESGGEVTRFSTFDISDPRGHLAAGATFRAPGRVLDRWCMDRDDAAGILRAVLARGSSGGATVRAWSMPGAATATPLGEVTVGAGEGLTAARFDGHRAYVVTARSFDPLFVVDTSDPVHPSVTGAVEMPGQLDFIEPRGDRLVALGHTNEGGQRWQLAASLFDVAASPPKLLSRALIGSGPGWVNAGPDDLRKVLQVIDAQGLVLVPFSGWDDTTWRFAGGVQLLDLAGDALVKRGFVAHPGVVTRAFPLPGRPGQLAAFSDQRLQVLDATSRDTPVERGTGLDLSRWVAELAFVNGAAAELTGGWFGDDTQLVIASSGDLDAPVPLARFTLAAPHARLFTVGSTAWLLAQAWSYGAQPLGTAGSGATSWLQAVDLSDAARPRAAARLDLEPPAGTSGLGCGSAEDAVLVGSALVLRQEAGGKGRICAGVAGGAPGLLRREANPPRSSAMDPSTDELLVYDLQDPDAPRLASRLTLPAPANGWSSGLTLSAGQLWLTHFEQLPGTTTGEGRYFLDRIDVGRPEAPRLVPKVNVPGTFLAAEPGGRRVYTQETLWEPSPTDGNGTGKTTTWFRALDLTSRGTARLVGSVAVDGWLSQVVVDQGFAYAVRYGAWPSTPRSSLVAVDLRALRAATAQDVQAGYAWPLGVAGDKLFISSGFPEAVLVYGLADRGHPTFERDLGTGSSTSSVVEHDGVAYLAGGPYGVAAVPLGP